MAGCGGGATTQTTEAGGASAAPTTTATADAMSGMDMIGQSPAQHAGHTAGEHEKHVVQRTAPVNQALAKKNLSAVMDFFGNFTRDKLTFRTPGATHGKLSAAQKAAFHAKYPDLPVPNAVVFDKHGGKPIGVVYSQKGSPVELGMGNAHQHRGPDSVFMEHIWFTPNDLNTAFGDTEGGNAKRANQIVNGGGAPGKK
jgi:hypothetical protein